MALSLVQNRGFFAWNLILYVYASILQFESLDRITYSVFLAIILLGLFRSLFGEKPMFSRAKHRKLS